MKKYIVRVETPGKLIFFKNRKIRSPFTLEVSDSDLELLKATMTSSAIDKYEIKDYKEKEKSENDDVWENVIIPKDKEVVIEEMFIKEENEPSTLLEKLLRDEKNGE